MEFFKSFGYKSMSFANRDCLISSFPIWMPFISSSYLTSLARNFRTMLNKSGESEHPCLLLNFRGNSLFFPFSMILAIGLSHIAFIILRYSPSIPSFIRVLSWKDVEFCQRLFLHLLRWSHGFCLCFC
jgi:hypothetical protein